MGGRPADAGELTLPAAVADELLAHARAELPNEACGLLSGDRARGLARRFHPARNAEASQYVYSVHPEDLVRIVLGIEREGEDLVAIFHSHPGSPAVPSATDLREARYPDALHLIVAVAEAERHSPDAMRAWRIADGAGEPVRVRIG